MLTIKLAQPISRVRVLRAVRPATGGSGPAKGDPAQSADSVASVQAERARMARELEQQNARFDQLCRSVGGIADKLDRLYQDTLAANRAEIARLAVEIARKILLHKVTQGDYDIQAIIEEALKRAPTRQSIVIHLNPEDLPRCQQHQQENPGSPFAELELVADWSIGRGECLVETPKGIVKSFIEEHLERIGEALQRIDD
jgi:flagellar assembly protein FliH